MKTWRDLPEVTATDEEVMTYAQVRKLFGWATNFPLKRAVERGDLTRVRTGRSRKSFRVTAASVKKFRDALQEEIETARDFGVSPGEWAERKKNRAREAVPEVKLDERQIMEHYHAPAAPAPEPLAIPAPVVVSEEHKLAAYLCAKGAARVQAYRALDWRTRNKIIEMERSRE